MSVEARPGWTSYLTGLVLQVGLFCLLGPPVGWTVFALALGVLAVDEQGIGSALDGAVVLVVGGLVPAYFLAWKAALVASLLMVAAGWFLQEIQLRYLSVAAGVVSAYWLLPMRDPPVSIVAAAVLSAVAASLACVFASRRLRQRFWRPAAGHQVSDRPA